MDRQNKIVGVIGRKGSGKSTIFRKILQRSSCIFLFDTMGEHDWIPNRFYTLDEVRQFLGWARSQRQFAGSFIPEDDLEASFQPIADWAYREGELSFGIEEVPFFCSPGHVPAQLDRIVRLGRHRQLSVIYTGQRMSEIARRLTAATDAFVLFQHTEPIDLDAIAARCGRDVAQRVSALPVHSWLAWDAIFREVSAKGELPNLDEHFSGIPAISR
jgi:hypothetical protein